MWNLNLVHPALFWSHKNRINKVLGRVHMLPVTGILAGIDKNVQFYMGAYTRCQCVFINSGRNAGHRERVYPPLVCETCTLKRVKVHVLFRYMRELTQEVDHIIVQWRAAWRHFPQITAGKLIFVPILGKSLTSVQRPFVLRASKLLVICRNTFAPTLVKQNYN